MEPDFYTPSTLDGGPQEAGLILNKVTLFSSVSSFRYLTDEGFLLVKHPEAGKISLISLSFLKDSLGGASQHSPYNQSLYVYNAYKYAYNYIYIYNLYIICIYAIIYNLNFVF